MRFLQHTSTGLVCAILVLAGYVMPFSAAPVVAAQKTTIGERYHSESSLTWTGMRGDDSTRRPAMPPQFKDYPGAQVISLPAPDYNGLSVEKALRNRRSVRTYSSAPLTLKQLSQLLFSAQGVTGGSAERPLRTAPSAGALYPFEVYVVVHRAEGIAAGMYHYAVREHALELLKEGNLADETAHAALNQGVFNEAAVTLILTAIFDRTRSKYGERGFRYVYIEAGHIAQNLCLEAVSLGLGPVPVGAFIDDEVNQLVGVDGFKEAAIYLLAVGVP